MDTRVFNEFVDLEVKKDSLEKELKKTKERMTELEPLIMTELTGIGENSFKIGGRTVYIRRDVYASPDSEKSYGRSDVVAALKQSDELSHYVHEDFHDASIKSYVRDLVGFIEDEAAQQGVAPTEAMIRERLPDPLREVLKVGFKYSIKSNKAGGERTKWES